ncbi:methylaspartate ammonia-lyase [Streptomyces sp. NPDC001393]
MTKISQVLASVGLACDYYTDYVAMDADRRSDGVFVLGKPVTPGFTSIHERARSLNIQLLLEDGSVGLGDCVSVIRAGIRGRAAPLSPEDYEPIVTGSVSAQLTGVEVSSFRKLATLIDGLATDGQYLHPGIAYGLSQAMLGATAAAQRRTMAEVLVEEYGLPAPTRTVPIFGCCNAREHPDQVDRLILGRADALPHGGFTSVELIGAEGEKLLDFVSWMSSRIQTYGDSDYRPVVHLDVYGTIGRICDGDLGRMKTYLGRLLAAAAPLRLRLEDPVSAGDAVSSREAMGQLVAFIDAEGLPVEVVADEYCNTREDIALWAQERAAHLIHVKTPDLGSLTNTADAILECRRAGVGVYVGGTMNDTEVSGRACTHMALAFGADVVMAKPGAWPDVSLALTHNEMERTLRLSAAR